MDDNNDNSLEKFSGDQHENLMSRTSSYFSDFTQEVREEPRPRDFPYQTLVSRRSIDSSHQKDPVLSIKSYFPTSSSINKDKPQSRNYSFQEWLKARIRHTNVEKFVKNVVLNEWILDSFDLANEYELRIGKKGYILDDIWEKCKRVHGVTSDLWHDKGHEEERWKSGLDNKYYDLSLVCVETFEVKRYSFEVGKSFVCVTKQLQEDLPLGRVNVTMFRGMIHEEMDREGSVQREA
ncbi:hypothetical protein Tco_1483520 [Tanacetum coccineum]